MNLKSHHAKKNDYEWLWTLLLLGWVNYWVHNHIMKVSDDTLCAHTHESIFGAKTMCAYLTVTDISTLLTQNAWMKIEMNKILYKCLHRSIFLQSQSFFLKRRFTNHSRIYKMKVIVSVVKDFIALHCFEKRISQNTRMNLKWFQVNPWWILLKVWCDFRFWFSLSSWRWMADHRNTTTTSNSQHDQLQETNNSLNSLNSNKRIPDLMTVKQLHGFQSFSTTKNRELMAVTKLSKIGKTSSLRK